MRHKHGTPLAPSMNKGLFCAHRADFATISQHHLMQSVVFQRTLGSYFPPEHRRICLCFNCCWKRSILQKHKSLAGGTTAHSVGTLYSLPAEVGSSCISPTGVIPFPPRITLPSRLAYATDICQANRYCSPSSTPGTQALTVSRCFANLLTAIWRRVRFTRVKY